MLGIQQIAYCELFIEMQFNYFQIRKFYKSKTT